MTANLRQGFAVFALPVLSWWFSCRSLGCPGGLVVPGRVEGELPEELAGGGVDDPDLKVPGDQQDARPGVGSPGADVVQAAAGAQRDGPRGVDAIGPDARSWVSASRLPGVAFGRAW